MEEGGHWASSMLVRECSMEETSAERPMEERHWVRVLQVTGCFPLPPSQHRIISMVIRSASRLNCELMAGMMDPSLSSSNRVPNIS